MVVVPSHKAAMSKTRLEILFEPGRVTVPDALESAGRSRNSVENIGGLFANGGGHAPLAAGLTGVMYQFFQGVGAAVANELFHRLQIALKKLALC